MLGCFKSCVSWVLVWSLLCVSALLAGLFFPPHLPCIMFVSPALLSVFFPSLLLSSHLSCISLISPALLPVSSQPINSQHDLLSRHLFPIPLLVLSVFKSWSAFQCSWILCLVQFSWTMSCIDWRTFFQSCLACFLCIRVGFSTIYSK